MDLQAQTQSNTERLDMLEQSSKLPRNVETAFSERFVNKDSFIASKGTMSGGILDIFHPKITITTIATGTSESSTAGGSSLAVGVSAGRVRFYEGSNTQSWVIHYNIQFKPNV